MKLTELNPKLAGDVLTFDCPVCTGDKAHRVRVPIAERVKNQHGCWWRPSGEFPDTLTLSPSIDCGIGCWHGYVQAGRVTPL